jgi:hypothetical protein
VAWSSASRSTTPTLAFASCASRRGASADLVTVIGHAPTISAGEFVQASGTWVNDRTLTAAACNLIRLPKLLAAS